MTTGNLDRTSKGRADRLANMKTTLFDGSRNGESAPGLADLMMKPCHFQTVRAFLRFFAQSAKKRIGRTTHTFDSLMKKVSDQNGVYEKGV